jgi:hypothetical protein
MRMRLALPTLLLVALAGCGQLESAADSTPASDVEAPRDAMRPNATLGDGLPQAISFVYKCPAGETHQTAAGVCVGSRATLLESRQEPYLAVHPTNPEIVAVAVNYGAYDRTSWLVGDAAVASEPLEISISEDAGATWRPSFPPSANQGKSAGQGDPTIRFDPVGNLHFSAMDGNKIVYARSMTLGRTWSKVHVLETEDLADRNWLTVGPDGHVFVSWQRPDLTQSLIAWSLDNGETFQVTSPGQLPCLTISAALAVGEHALFACSTDSKGTAVQLYRFNTATGDLSASQKLPVTGLYPMLTQFASGRLLVSTKEGDRDTQIATSDDGGISWTRRHSLRDLLTIDDEWQAFNRNWIASDPWGNIHVIVAGQIIEGDEYGFIESSMARMQEVKLAHAVLDADLAVILETPLVQGDVASPRRVPPSLGPPTIGDHFHGIDFSNTEGWMAWTWDRGIEFTRLDPVFG